MGKNNVNKNHYIEPYGRERQGEDVVQEIHREELSEKKKEVKDEFVERAEESDPDAGS